MSQVESTVIEWIMLSVLLMLVGALMPVILDSINMINFTSLGVYGTALQTMFSLIPFILGLGIFINTIRKALKF